MAVKSICDTCERSLDPAAVVGLRLAEGRIRGTDKVAPHFVASGRPTDLVVCVSCAAYLAQCVEALKSAESRA